MNSFAKRRVSLDIAPANVKLELVFHFYVSCDEKIISLVGSIEPRISVPGLFHQRHFFLEHLLSAAGRSILAHSDESR
jgi:hypothetical protein